MQRGIQVYFDDKKYNKSYLVPGTEYYAAKITSEVGTSAPYHHPENKILYKPPNKTYYTTNTPIPIGRYKERRDHPRGYDYVFDTEAGIEKYVRINNPAPLSGLGFDNEVILSSTNIEDLEKQPSRIPKYGFISKEDLAEQTPAKGGKKRRRTKRKRPKRKSRKNRRKSIRR